jgi:uncharacterized protein
MNIFAIGDLHLGGGTGKTMDRFGEHWRDHDQKIFTSWERLVGDDDLVIVAGDTSWAMHLNEAMVDLDRIGRAKGSKLLVKGNHDYWWETKAKLERTIDPSIKILQSNSYIINRIAIAGTRGWICPNDMYFDEQAARIYEREVSRLRTALESTRGRESEFDSLVVALHFPPTNASHVASGFTDLIDQFGAAACVYGHLHGDDIKSALQGIRGKTKYCLVSSDAVGFAPKQIWL